MHILRSQKCVTSPYRLAPSALLMQIGYNCSQCLFSQGWLSFRYFRWHLKLTRNSTDRSSSPSSPLWCSYVLTTGNWGTWYCSWDRLQSRDPKSSGCNTYWTQFSLNFAKPWPLSAGLPRWSRCSGRKLLLSSLLLPWIASWCKTSTLFRR